MKGILLLLCGFWCTCSAGIPPSFCDGFPFFEMDTLGTRRYYEKECMQLKCVRSYHEFKWDVDRIDCKMENGTCLTLNEMYYDKKTCKHYECKKDEGLVMWQIDADCNKCSGGCEIEGGRCLSVGETYYDKKTCTHYDCKPGEGLTMWKTDAVCLQCDDGCPMTYGVEQECIKIRKIAVFPDYKTNRCMKIRCRKNKTFSKPRRTRRWQKMKDNPFRCKKMPRLRKRKQN